MYLFMKKKETFLYLLYNSRSFLFSFVYIVTTVRRSERVGISITL